MVKRLTRRQSAPTLAAVSEHESPSTAGTSTSDVTEEEAQARKFQARLRAFYWAHDPRQVDKVEEILERQKGKEEAFIQRVHMQFGARDFSGETAVDDLYEHERYSYFSFSYGSSFPGHLLPTDRRRWGALHGSPSSQTRERVEPQLPVNWVWTTPWHVDTHTGNCDKDGWIYAFDFTMINSAIKRTGGRSEPRATDYVRRRRWIRQRQRVVAAPVALPAAATPQVEEDQDEDDEETENQSEDAHNDDAPQRASAGNQNRVSRLESAPKRIEDVANDLNIDDDDDADDGDNGYDEDDEAETSAAAVTSNQTDASDDRRVASPPLSMNLHDTGHELRGALPSLSPSLRSILRTPGTVNDATETPSPHLPTAATPQLELFSMAMDKAAVDAAWTAAVKELEAIYTRAKTHKTQRLKQWRVTREKLKRQIHVLEKTIASMETVALEEEKRRRTSASANSSPRKPSFAFGSPRTSGTGSPQGAASPMATPSRGHPVNRNAVNVVNLAAKMQSAQSKLDALKRLLWHSREKQYTLRFSIDGIFYGLRDFHVESFTSTYAVHMSHQTNGAQGITPTCKVVLKGHTVCVGKHVKVTGDKGTRVPKSIWERMYLDTDFDASVYLIYVDDDVHDDATPKRERHGRWEFLFTPDATRVELSNFTRRVHGGLDLPEPVVRKLCSDVLSSLVRDLALIYFPHELATAFDAPPAKLDLVGDVSLTGLPIDDVLEREIESMSDARDESASSSKSLLAAAAQLLVFRDTDASMQRIADALRLSPAQFNLLVALKDCGLYPPPYSFRSLASMCEYYARFFVEERPASGDDSGGNAYTQRLRRVWKQVVELLYIRKVRAGSTDAAALALFDMDALWDAVARLSQKPAALALTVKHLHCSVRAQSVVDAVAKLYERLVLGVDFSKPRTGYDAFLYGFRFGRKAAAVPQAVATAVADATSRSTATAATVLDPRLHIQLDSAFRARLKAFSQFVRSLKALVDVATHNVESVSVEVAGHLKGTGSDCDLAGSFRDVDFVGPVHVALGIPACFLGLYRIETVAMDSGDDGDATASQRVGLQIELLLPRAAVRPTAATRRRKQPLAATLESVGRVLVTDVATQVLVDVDALVEQHRIRTASAAAEMTAPWSPTKSFARRVETQATHVKHEALAFSFGHCASQRRSSDIGSLGDGVTRVPSTPDLEAPAAPLAKASSPFALSTSEFTKLHAQVRAGSFATRVLPILDYVLATYVRPLVQSSCPEHQALLDSVLASALQWLSAPSMALDFDVVTRACVHGRDDLVVTIASAPLHAAPIVYNDELLLLPLILHADDLVNQWIDDRYPPYSNPLYF